MSTYNIADSDDTVATEAITDPVIADAITDFKSKLDETGVVSKGSVLALEELIGKPIVTDNIPTNIFTEVPSTSGTVPLGKVLTGVIQNIQDVCGLTIDDLYRDTAKLLSMTNNLKHIATQLTRISPEVIERMTNEKYIMTYDTNDRLVDLNSINILETLHWNNAYTSVIFPEEYINILKEKIAVQENSISSIPLKLLSAIKDNKLDMYSIQRTQYDMITQNDILELITGPKFLENTTNLYNSISNYMSDLKKEWVFYEANIRELTKESRRIGMLTDFLKDELSVGILQTYAAARMNI